MKTFLGLARKVRLLEKLKRDALKFGTFPLASGKISNYYIDCRQVTLSADGAFLIALGMLEQISNYTGVVAIGGITLGADPIVGATIAMSAIYNCTISKGFIVRKKIKDHGTGNLIEGPLEPGSNVAIVDDVITTGGSSLQAIEAVQAIGCKVILVTSVIDRLEGANQAFSALNIPFHPLFTIRDLGIND